MPCDNGSGSDQDKRLLPARPQPSQPNPEQLLRHGEASARPLGVQSEQLLTQGEVFEDEILPGAKGTAKPAEEVPEPNDHGKNLIRRSRSELIANSLISRAHDVLMTHRTFYSSPLHRQASCLFLNASFQRKRRGQTSATCLPV